MKQRQNHSGTCQLTGTHLPFSELVPINAVNPAILELIRQQKPDFVAEGCISRRELDRFRMQFMQQTLESEKGELSQLDKEVLESIASNELLSQTLHESAAENLTFGERMADHIASFGGSWTFIGIFFLFLLSWMGVNVFLLATHPFDPYPFILLNLILSCLAAIQAPVIMMSQNRQEAKDRERAQHDYQINLKAELEIRQLNEKVDHLLMQQGQRLLEIQQIQLELMEEIAEKIRK